MTFEGINLARVVIVHVGPRGMGWCLCKLRWRKKLVYSQAGNTYTLNKSGNAIAGETTAIHNPSIFYASELSPRTPGLVILLTPSSCYIGRLNTRARNAIGPSYHVNGLGSRCCDFAMEGRNMGLRGRIVFLFLLLRRRRGTGGRAARRKVLELVGALINNCPRLLDLVLLLSGLPPC